MFMLKNIQEKNNMDMSINALFLLYKTYDHDS